MLSLSFPSTFIVFINQNTTTPIFDALKNLNTIVHTFVIFKNTNTTISAFIILIESQYILNKT